jgi:hypothetical protein
MRAAPNVVIRDVAIPNIFIPAQAGIHMGERPGSIAAAEVMDSRLRGNDGGVL